MILNYRLLGDQVKSARGSWKTTQKNLLIDKPREGNPKGDG